MKYSMPPKILINGDFLCRRLTGIKRYAYEITRRLDKPRVKNYSKPQHIFHYYWNIYTITTGINIPLPLE